MPKNTVLFASRSIFHKSQCKRSEELSDENAGSCKPKFEILKYGFLASKIGLKNVNPGQQISRGQN